jgi:hypothetical protein
VADVSHQADRRRQLPANPPDQKGVAEDPDSRLVANIRMSKRLKPFVNRMRLRLKDLDLTDPDAAARLDQAQEDMWSVLKKKKISRTIANQIIAETLDAAVNHRLESLRRDQNLKHLAQANSNINRLIKHVERLAQMLAKLPRPTKGKLNKIMAGLNWRQFDTEVFAEFVNALLDVLSNVPASRFAADARSSIVDSLRSSDDRVATKINRTAPPAIVELWDAIPAATRTQVESNLRAWAAVSPWSGSWNALLLYSNSIEKKSGEVGTLRLKAVMSTWLRQSGVARAWGHRWGSPSTILRVTRARMSKAASSASVVWHWPQ